MPALAASPEAISVPHRIATVVRADAKTGRLVRAYRVENAPAVPADLRNLIDSIAHENGVETSLVHSVILTESNYNAAAVSPKGALGLMQLIPATAKRFGVADAFDVKDNIQGGVRYLRHLLDYYQNDYPKAIAAYNAGEAAVDKFHGIPPFAETRNYVNTVAHNLNAARAKAEVTIASAAPAIPEGTRTVIAFTTEDGRLFYRTP